MFVRFIKNLITIVLSRKKKNQIKVEDITIINEEYKIDDIKIVEKQEDLLPLHSCENININWQLISELSSYDIVLIEFPNSNETKEDFKKRPFLITKLNYEPKTVSGYAFTSNMQNTYYNKPSKKCLKLVLDKNKYNISKNSLVKYEHETELPYENIIHKLDRLSAKDLSRLKKFKSLTEDCKVISSKEECFIEIGDVISEDNLLYIIYQKDNTYSYGYTIEKVDNSQINIEDNFNYIIYNGNIYFIDFSKNKKFANSDNILIVDIFSLNMIDVIKENKKKLKIAQKTKK